MLQPFNTAARKRLITIFAAAVLSFDGFAAYGATTPTPAPVKTTHTTTVVPPPKKTARKQKHHDKNLPKKETSPFSLKPSHTYYYMLGKRESKNNYKRLNSVGCAGRWQFCKKSKGGPGWGKYAGDVKGWIDHPAYQDRMMVRYTRHNWNDFVRHGMTKYLCTPRVSAEGKHFLVSQSGMLAAAHLGGERGVEKFLQHGIDRRDIYQTYISSYMTLYADYPVPGQWADLSFGKTAASCPPAKKRHDDAKSNGKKMAARTQPHRMSYSSPSGS